MKYQDYIKAPFLILISVVLTAICLVLPYRMRAGYVRLVALFFHFPYYLFGKIATFLFKQLALNPETLKQ